LLAPEESEPAIVGAAVKEVSPNQYRHHGLKGLKFSLLFLGLAIDSNIIGSASQHPA
jgi:hypothetical protein